MPAKRKSSDEGDAVVERLRDFIRLNYITTTELARYLGVGDRALYSWLKGEFSPENPAKITAFLDSLPAESGSGITPVGYQYREYKNWRGIPRPRRCPFCKQAKGEIRKARSGFKASAPSAERRGPRRNSHDEALRAWNGKD